MRKRTLILLALLFLVAGELRWGWVTLIPAEPYVWNIPSPFDTGPRPPADWQQWVTTFWDRGPLPLPGDTIVYDRTPPLRMESTPSPDGTAPGVNRGREPWTR
jgi:hypothetical protein